MTKCFYHLLWAGLFIPGMAMTEETPPHLQLDIPLPFGKTEQTSMEIPASTSTLSRDDLLVREIRGVDQAANHIPNLLVMGQGTGGRSNYVFMRGVGSTHNDPAISFLVDDVPMSNEGLFDLDFTDVERIEVLRGPQGTLHGRNALGGVIHVVSEPPGNGPAQAQLSVNAGNLGFLREQVKLQAPIEGTSLYLRLSGDHEKRHGYSRNLITGSDAEWVDKTAGQLRLKWFPVGPTDADFILRYQDSDMGGFAANPPGQLVTNPYEVRLNKDGMNRKKQTTTSLRVNHEATNFSLVSITAADFWRNRLWGDADYSSADLAVLYLNENKTQISQEFRILSPKNGKSTNRWLAGFYLAQDRFDRDSHLAYQQGAVVAGLMAQPLTDALQDVTQTQNMAIFGEITRNLMPKLDLTVGIRYDMTRKTSDLSRVFQLNGTPVPGTATASNLMLTENHWLPKLTTQYHLMPDHSLYASVAKGYRNGGFNTYASNTANARFAPEFLWNYEVGFKSVFKPQQLQVTGALFDLEWRDQQVQQILPNFAPVTRNAGRSRSQGGELELAWIPVEDTRITLAYGYTDARFITFKDQVLGQDYAGRRIPLAPLHTVALGGEHRRDLGEKWTWFGRVDLTGRGNIYWDSANTAKQDLTPLFHLRTGLTYENLEMAIWGHNIFGKAVQIFGEESPTLGSRVLYGEPRTVGVSLQGTFK
ncbi:MAG: TonB-dependent receptor [Magnetococcales bacterium]|nr:TonB-dependent receptor [Magnetococcales bacterium]NGZ29119.1 TonB-dependent receptor [Magnetococcales bacterium]